MAPSPNGSAPSCTITTTLRMAAIMRALWQKINAHCHSCHCWQVLHDRIIIDMTTAALLIALTVAAVVFGKLLASYVRNEGFGPAGNPPRSHYADPFESRSFLN